MHCSNGSLWKKEGSGLIEISPAYVSCLSPFSFGKVCLNPSVKTQMVQLVYGSGPRLNICSLPSHRMCWMSTRISGHLLLIYTDLELAVYQILKELQGRAIWGSVSHRVLLLQFYVWIHLIPAAHQCSSVQWSERGDLIMVILVFLLYSLVLLGFMLPLVTGRALMSSLGITVPL